MNTFQVTMLALACLLVLSIFASPVITRIKDLLSRTKVPSILNKPDKDGSNSGTRNPTVVEVVKEWEDLKKLCEQAKLVEACKELDSIFPLFVNKGDKNVKKS